MSSAFTSAIAGNTTHAPAETTPHPRRRSPDAIPRHSPDVVHRHRTLNGVIKAASQADGIGLIDVDAFTTLVVQTDNSVYRITILTPHLREVLVQGGKFFPERTRAVRAGQLSGYIRVSQMA